MNMYRPAGIPADLALEQWRVENNIATTELAAAQCSYWRPPATPLCPNPPPQPIWSKTGTAALATTLGARRREEG